MYSIYVVRSPALVAFDAVFPSPTMHPSLKAFDMQRNDSKRPSESLPAVSHQSNTVNSSPPDTQHTSKPIRSSSTPPVNTSCSRPSSCPERISLSRVRERAQLRKPLKFRPRNIQQGFQALNNFELCRRQRAHYCHEGSATSSPETTESEIQDDAQYLSESLDLAQYGRNPLSEDIRVLHHLSGSTSPPEDPRRSSGGPVPCPRAS